MAVGRRTIEEVLAEARRVVRRLSPEQAEAAQRAGAIIVDTRELRFRRTEGAIPGAVDIPLSVLPWRLDPDSPFRTPIVDDLSHQVVLVCSDGYSSSLAGEWLVRIGFRCVSDVIGGFRAWSSDGRPVIASGKGRIPRAR